ncbi:MAG: GDSL-like Lipase/Acylhydrolase [Firmicutes bacterium ADurb.Bin419]|nr:MAG: GDSL-like Lipase/Acylhydrolase [Firmicutes bacterium ADurb.Bin419]
MIYGLMLVLICLVFLELYFSYVVFTQKRGKSWYAFLRNAVYRFDPVSGYFYTASNTIKDPMPPTDNAPRSHPFINFRTNKEGFVGAENIEDLVTDYKTIFCIGGSTTACSDCDYDKTYPAILDSLTRSHGYAVINAGINGYRSIQELICLKTRIVKYNPKMVILFSGYNDFQFKIYIDQDINNQFINFFKLPDSRLEWVLNYSGLYNTFRQFLIENNLMNAKKTWQISDAEVIKRMNDAIDHPDDWFLPWRANVKKLGDVCRENNIKLVLLSHPSPVFDSATSEEKQFAEIDIGIKGRFDCFVRYINFINEKTRELCVAESYVYVDITEDLDSYCRRFHDGALGYAKARFGLFVDRMHFSEDGSLFVANVVFNKIKGLL